jgi:predicted aminopeptidase
MARVLKARVIAEGNLEVHLPPALPSQPTPAYDGVVMVRVLCLVGWIFLLCGCATQAGYLAKQGRHLLCDNMGAKPVESLIASRQTDAETRAFLIRAAEIRRFAVERIGLRKNGNFTRYKDIGRDYLVSVVSACAADSFQAYTWRYPFLGSLPYRGFYESDDADKEAARLKAEGWDVVVRPVDSFSTLGFTRDPLYSFMKSYSAFEFASLIFHEQTHATLFVKGQTQFSEELASFVGEEGALAWLAETRGITSPEYLEALDEIADLRAFLSLLRDLRNALERVYRSPFSREEKLAKKSQIIAAFEAGFAAGRKTWFRTEGFRSISTPRVNNAYLSLTSLYSDDVPLIRSYFKELCGGDLRRLLADARDLARRGDVKAQMRRALER